MTRNQIKKKVISIIEDIVDDIIVLDDSGLYIPQEAIEKKAEEIMKLWDQGFVYDRPYEDRSGESMHETLSRMRYSD